MRVSDHIRYWHLSEINESKIEQLTRLLNDRQRPRETGAVRKSQQIQISKSMSRQLTVIFSMGHDPAEELCQHPGYGEAERRKLGHFARNDPVRYGRCAAIG